MIGSPAKRLGVALLGTALIAGALFIAATGERTDVGAALLGILPFGIGDVDVRRRQATGPGSRSGMDIRLVDGHSATVFAISVGRAVLVALGFVFVALAGVGMAIFSETLDDPTTLRIAGIALALLFGGLALRDGAPLPARRGRRDHPQPGRPRPARRFGGHCRAVGRRARSVRGQHQGPSRSRP